MESRIYWNKPLDWIKPVVSLMHQTLSFILTSYPKQCMYKCNAHKHECQNPMHTSTVIHCSTNTARSKTIIETYLSTFIPNMFSVSIQVSRRLSQFTRIDWPVMNMWKIIQFQGWMSLHAVLMWFISYIKRNEWPTWHTCTVECIWTMAILWKISTKFM